MMKKICLLVAFFVLGKMWSYAQYPITQTLGSDSTIVISKGALQSRLINVTYTDTTAANLQRIRQYPGAQIATTTGGLNLWVRNANATAWIPVATGSGNNIYTIDGTLLGNRTLTGAGYSLTFNQLSKLLFNADSTTINTDQATILNNGLSTLSVKGAGARTLLIDTTAPADERIYELKSSNGEFYISILNDAQTSNDSAFLITSASRVGINTLNPDSTLKVGGGVNILGGLRVGNLPTSPGTKQLRINAQGQFSVIDTLIDAGGTVTSIATNNGSGITGGTITTTGTLAIDTTNVIATKASVSGGLAGKLNISDTAAMLAPYLRAIDTASLSNRINLKLNISDTATMLGNYLNNVGYGLSKAGQVASADSATLSAYYLRRKDSLTATNPLGYVTQKILSDTAAAIRSSDLGGTVTSVATNNGTGITGGTITTSGTLAIDTLLVSTRAWRQKGVDSVAALANTKISGSLISGYLTKATGSLTIDTSQLYQSSGLIGIGTTSPTQKLQVSGNAFVNGQLFAGDTALSTYQVEGILSTPYVLGRKAVDNTLSTEARPTGIQGHVVGRGSIANRLQGGTFYATTDSASTANSTGSLRASNSWSAHNGSGTLANAWGSYNIVQNKTTGTITNAYGSVSGVENRGATSTINKLHGTTTEIWNNFGGTVDTAFGQVISIYNNNAASNIGAVYGLSIGKGLVTPTGGTHYWKNSGTIGTSYGLYLDTSIDVGATKYSIFSNSNSNSYFKGKLGVGTTSPDSAFQVATGAYFQRGIRASALPQAPGTKALRIDASGTISYADTLIDAGGTVTSVATNNGTGITGGTITTTGTLAIDTLLISTRAWRQKGIDSIRANYVPYTGATTNVDINTRLLSANSFKANGNGVSSGGYLGFQQFNGTTSALSGYTVISALQQNTLNLSYAQIPSGTKTARLSSSLITTDSTYDYNFPNKGGTFAMTSDVTGAVSGTTNYIPKFTSSSAIGNSAVYDNSGNIGINNTSASNKLVVTNTTNSANAIAIFEQNQSSIVNAIGLVQIKGVAGETSAGGKLEMTDGTYSSYIQGGRNANLASSLMIFGVGGSEQMRLTSTGLGIGTSSPAVKLDVNGAGNFTGSVTTSSSNGYNVQVSGGNAYRMYATVNDLVFRSVTAGSDIMTLTYGGNLGLGTSTPDRKLVIQGAFNSNEQLLYLKQGDNNGFSFNLDAAVTGNLMIKGVNSGTETSSLLTIRRDNGNTGIGTSAPAEKLDVYDNSASNVSIKVGNTSGALQLLQGNGAAYLYTATNQPLIFSNNNSEKMRLDASGNLIVGGTTAYAKFTIAGNTTASAADNRIVIVENPPSGNLGSQIAWTNSSTTYPYASVGFNNGSGGTSGNLIFSTNGNIFTNTNTERMRLDANGNLGIGTSSPTQALDVLGIINIGRNQNAFVTNFNINSGSTPISAFQINTDQPNLIAALVSRNSYALTFGTSDTERMRITSGGNVGIGTTSPTHKLNIASDGYNFRIANSSNAQGYNIGRNVSDGLLYFYGDESGYVGYVFSGVNGERMRITSGGNVGIGTTSPTFTGTDGGLQISRSTTPAALRVTSGTSNFDIANDGAGIYQFVRSNDALIFGTNNTERMRITSGGELLINTTSDAGDYKLQVNGDVYATGGYESKGNYPSITLNANSGTNFYIQSTYTSNQLDIGIVGTGSLFTLTSGGAIKTAAPSGGTAKPYKLGEAGVAIGGSDGYAVKVEIDGTLYYLMTGYLPEPEPEAQAGPSMGYKTQFEQPVIKIKSDNQKIKDLEKEIAELKELIKSKIK